MSLRRSVLNVNVKRCLFMLAMVLMSGFVYAQEICDNEQDDDNDVLIDCYDPDCYASGFCNNPLGECSFTSDPVNSEFATRTQCSYLDGAFYINGVYRNFNPSGYDTPKSGDVDHDGQVELIVVSDGGDEGIYIFNPNTCEPKYYIQCPMSDSHGGVSFADVDGDGYAEIFVVTGNDSDGGNTIRRYDFNSTNWVQEWSISNYNKRGFPPDIIDFNGDGTPELITYGWVSATNRQIKILNVSDGSTLVDFSSNTTLMDRLYWKDVYAYADVIPTGFDPDGTGPKTPLLYADGPEIIFGNRIFTVDIATHQFEDVYGIDPLTNTGAVSDHSPWVNGMGDNDAGQKVSLADVNMDGHMDVIVAGQGYISVWDPLTNRRLYPRFTLAGGANSGKGGVVCVGDVDGDANNRPELGVVSVRQVEVIKVNSGNTALERVWNLGTTDASGETAMNFFDFEGNGTAELVYRDQDTIKVYVGAGNGTGLHKILFQDPYACHSNTGGEHPIIADVDGDNRAEIIASCQEGIRIYRDNKTPWISARSVFNQRAYNYTNINDDLSIPRVQQENHKVPYLNNYLTQLYQIDKAGNPYFPAPDFTVELEDVSTDVDLTSLCPNKISVRLKICNHGDALADYSIPLSFYQGSPLEAGAIFIQKSVVTVSLGDHECMKTSPIEVSLSDLYNSNGTNDGNLYFYINDDADGLVPNKVLNAPLVLPNSPYGECDYSNNLYGPINIVDCKFAPAIHAPASDFADEDILLVFKSANGNVISISDDDDDDQTIIISVSNSTFSLSGVSGLTFTTGDGVNDNVMVFNGSLASINAALLNAVLTPEANYNGTFNMQISTSDGSGGTVSKTISVTYNSINDVPVISDLDLSGYDDNNIVIGQSEFIAQYQDADGEVLNKIKVVSLPSNGFLKLAGVSVALNQEIVMADLNNLVFEPKPNWSGVTSFWYNASDGTSYATVNKSVNLTVLSQNDTPVLSEILITTPQNTALTFALSNFTTNFYDVDGDALATITILSLPVHGELRHNGIPISEFYELSAGQISALTYHPNNGFTGDDSFMWNASDGEFNAVADALVKIGVGSSNTAPAVSNFSKAISEDITLSFAQSDFISHYSDTEANALVGIRLTSLPVNGTLSLSGVALNVLDELTLAQLNSLVFTPNANWNGTNNFSWRATDGVLYSLTSSVITLTVTAVNDVPVVNSFSKTGVENGTVTFAASNFTSSFSDVENTLSKIRIVTLPANGNLRLSGVNIVAGQEIMASQLANVTFVPTAGWSGVISFVWNGSDGAAYASTGEVVTITISNVNTAPVLSGIEGASVSFTENGVAFNMTSSLSVNDDSSIIEGASVSITVNYKEGEDFLKFVNTALISGSYDRTTGILTLRGADTKANYEAALRTVQYYNLSDNPSALARTVTFQVTDGSLPSNTQSRTVNVIPVNDLPVLSNIESVGIFVNENSTVALTSSLVVTDLDDVNIKSAIVKMSINYVPGQDVLTFVNTPSISGSWDATNGTLTLTGSASLAAYQAALRSITYTNNSNAPITTLRTVTFTVNDGNGNSNVQFITVTPVAVNDAPVLSAIEATLLSFTENAAATVVTSSIIVSDPESSNIVGATVQITGGFVSNQDNLTFTAGNGITGSYDAATGMLILTGTTSLANYQTLLRTVAYRNSSDIPNTSTRTISFTVFDAESISNTVTRNITISSANDNPVISPIYKSLSVSTLLTFSTADFTSHFTDVDGNSMTQIQFMSANPGNRFFVDKNDNGVNNGGAETVAANTVISLTDLNLGRFKFQANATATTQSVNWRASDGTSNSANSTINIAWSGNTPPAIVNISKSADENATVTFATTDFSSNPPFSDADGNLLTNVQILTLPSNGILSSGGTPTIVGQVYTAANLATLIFTPAADWNGTTSFSWIAQDNGVQPKYSLNPANCNITINPIISAPSSQSFEVSFDEDNSYTFNSAQFAYSDPEGNAFTNIRISTVVSAGTLYRDANSDNVVDAGETLDLNSTVHVASLNQIKYLPAVNGNGTPYATFQYQVSDGTLYSTAVEVTINVRSVQENPVLNSIETGVLDYTEDDAATPVSSTITLSDPDNNFMSSATVQITSGYVQGQDYLTFSNTPYITGTWDGTTGTMTLSGLYLNSSYTTALRSVKYANSSNFPDILPREVTFTVNDGIGNSNQQKRIITVAPVNDLPFLNNVETTNLLFVENSAATHVTSTINVVDEDDVDIESATISIAANYQNSADVLSFVNTPKITGVWNAATGVLRLTGADSKENYVAALRSVTYQNTSNNPSGAARSIVFKMDDGDGFSNNVTRVINVSKLNDLPSAANNTVSTNEDTNKTFTVANFNFSDIDGSSLSKIKITSLETAGLLFVDANVNNVIDAGEDVVLNQEISAAAISKLKFKPNVNQIGSPYATFNFQVSDGVAYSLTSYVMTINVLSLNDAPTSADFSFTMLEDGVRVIQTSDIVFNDLDGDVLNKIRIVSTPYRGTLFNDANLNGSIDAGEALSANSELPKAVIDNQQLKYKPLLNANGANYTVFQYKVSDGVALSASSYRIAVNVTAVNDAPVGTNQTITGNEGMAKTITFANFGYSDIENDACTQVQITSLPSVGVLFNDANLNGVVDGGETLAVNAVVSKANIDNNQLKFINAVNGSGSPYASLQFKVYDGSLYSINNNVLTINIIAMPVVTLAVDNTSIAEAGGAATLTASLNYPSVQAVTVYLSYSGAAASILDYTSIASITIPAGSTSATAVITAFQDALDEDDEDIIVDISSVSNGKESGSQQITTSITDDDAIPSVAFTTASQSSIGETGTMTITAQLSAVSGRDVTVPFTVNTSSTAIGGGTDYTISSTPITIAAGSGSANITITINNDAIDEPNETVIVNMGSPTNAGTGAITTHTATITDDEDTPSVTLSIGNASIVEAIGSTTITATLSLVSSQDVTVNLGYSGTAATTDYTASSTITILAGSTTGTATITAVQDALDEPNETVIVDIVSVTNGTESVPQQVTTSITDDDAAPTVTLSIGSGSIAEAAGSTSVTATLNVVSGQDVTVNLGYTGTAATSDYTASSTITILAGATTGTATITAVQDALDEPNETVIVDITSVTNGTESGSQQVTTSITDDDAAPTVTLSIGSGSIAEAAGSTNVTATLNVVSSQNVTVNLGYTGTAATSDYTASSTITILAGATTGTATISAVQDALDEPNETVIVDITSVTNGTESGSQQVTTSITDDDAAPTVTLSIGSGSIAEATGSTSVTATLNVVSGQDVTVNMGYAGTAATTDYTASSITIFIPAGSITGTATITAVQDALDEINETVIVDITSVTNGTESVPQQVTTSITDDDAAPTVTLSIGSGSIAEAAGSTSVTATLNVVSGQDVTVNLGYTGTAATSDYTASSTITILAGANTGTATITAVQDALDEPNETVIVDITSVTNGTESVPQQVTTSITDDDAAPSVTLSIGSGSIAEAAGSTNVTATLNVVSGRDVTVNLGYTGTAAASDYTASSTITILAGATTGTATISAVQDALDEPNETVIVDITSVTNGTESGSQQVTTSITDDDAAPTVTLSIGSGSIAEATGSTSVTATLNVVSGQDVTVNLGYAGTASTTDYTASSTTITIPAGSTTGTATISAVQDALDEPNETVIVDIVSVTNGNESVPQQVTTSITDDDAEPTVTLSIGSGSIAEATGSTSVTATLNVVSGRDVTVNLGYAGTAATTDYTASSTITILAGATTETATITAVQDALDEPNETVVVDIASVTNGTESTPQQVTTSITDDDAAPTLTLSIGSGSIAESAGSTSVTATLNVVSGQDVTVNLGYTGTAATTDYTASSTTITIPAGSTTGTATITASQDALDETNETVIVDITSVTNGTESTPQQVTTSITDDDAAPSVTLSIGSGSIAEAAGSTFVTATLNVVSGRDVTVNLGYTGTAATSDYTASSTITILAGATTGTANISAVQDALDETNETVIVDIVSVTNGNESVPQQVTTSITDDDAEPTVTLSVDHTQINEAGGSAVLTATLNVVSSMDVTVNVGFTGTASQSDDYSTSGTIISIPAGSLSGSLTVTGIDDLIYEGLSGETIIVDITSVVNANEQGNQNITVTILDDETIPTLTIGDASTTEGGNITFKATLSGICSQVASFEYVTTDGTAKVANLDYNALTTSVLTFAAGETEKEIVVATNDDAVCENVETFRLTLSNAINMTFAQSFATGTITDNDGTATVTVEDAIETEGNTLKFTVTLNKAVEGGVGVTYSLIDGSAGSSDYSAVVSTLNFVGNAGETQTINVALASDNTVESTESFAVALSSTNSLVDATDNATASIIDNNGVAKLSVPNKTMNEDGSVTLNFTVDKAVQGGFLANYLFIDGSALKGTDFTATNGTLTFAGTAGEVQSIVINGISDNLVEGSETFDVQLSSVNTLIDASAKATVTIIDEDAANILIDDVEVNENSDALFTITLNKEVIGGFDVTYTFSDVSTVLADFDHTSGTVHFIGTAGETQTFSVHVIDDDIVEPSQQFLVNLSANNPLVNTDDTANGTIKNNDGVALLTVTDISGAEGSDLTYTVVLDKAVENGFDASYHFVNGTANGDDFSALINTLSFAGNAGESKDINVSLSDDDVVETTEDFQIKLSSLNTLVDASDDAECTITDNDGMAKITIESVNLNEDESTTLTITLDKAVQGGFTAGYTFSDETAVNGTDYNGVAGNLVFNGTEGEINTFTVSGISDNVIEGSEMFEVQLSATSTLVDASDKAMVTILDEDVANLTVADVTVSEGNNASFTIKLNKEVVGGFDIAYHLSDVTTVADDFDHTSGTVHFTGTADEEQTFTVTINDDNIVEPSQTFGVILTTTNAQIISDDTAVATITDNDGMATFTVADVTAIEGNALTFSVVSSKAIEGGADITFTITNGTADNSDYSYIAEILSFTGGAGESQTINVSIIDDNVIEAAETISLSLVCTNSLVDASDVATGTITDNDGTAKITIENVTLNEDESTTLTLTLDKAVQGGFTAGYSFADGTAVNGTDYNGVAGTLVFNGTEGETKQITVSGISDNLIEGSESFEVQLSATNTLIDASDKTTVTILDEDVANVTVADVIVSEGNNASFTIKLNKEVVGGFDVTYHLSDVTTVADDFDHTSGTVHFIGTAGEEQTFTVSINDDNFVEPSQIFGVALSSSNTAVITDDAASCSITDNDGMAVVTVEDVSATEGSTVKFIVTLNKDIEGGATVAYTFTNGSAGSDDFTAVNGNLNFIGTAGETKEVNVSLLVDNNTEADETFTIQLSSTNTLVDATDNAVGTISDQLIDNTAPVVMNDDIAAFDEDSSTSGNLLANDTDADGDALVINTTPVVAPAHGAVVINSDGTFTYTPDENYNGSDSFVYQVCDTRNVCNQATVTLTVQSVNDAPSAAGDIVDPINEDASAGGSLLTNDSDVDGDQLTINITPVSGPSHGTLTINSDGTFTYVPVANYNGSDSFVYSVCDINNVCSQATVSLTVNPVNDAPVVNNSHITIGVNAVSQGNLLNNATDVDNDALSINTTPVTIPAHGTLVINSDGTYTYTPSQDYVGGDSFTYMVCDINSSCATASVSLLIGTTNSLPVVNDDLFIIDEDNVASGNLLSNDSDADGDALIINTIPVTTPLHGTLVINTNGTFSYTPAKDYFGNDSFTYSACDVNGACDNAVVTLIINSVNDRPVAVYDVVVVNEDEVLNGDLLANASDTEGDAILFNETPVSNPAHGTLIIHSNGTFTYTPDADFNGLDSFYFEMCDANGGCTQSAIIVRTMSVNDVPLAMDDICYAQQNTSVTVNLLSNDEGLGDGGLKLSWVNPEHGTVVLVNDSTITYRPNPGFDGVEYFRYTICDSENECSEALVTINATGCDLIIPEGFSPNGDGVNDLFVMPDLNRFTKVSIEVFNRWGNVVYKVNKYENNWNGESNVGFSIGKELPTGTYFYIITISDNNKKYTGYIYLNR